MIRVLAFAALVFFPAFVIWRRRSALKKPGPRIEPSQQPLDLSRFEGPKR